jgi:hypothetical protein
MQKKGLKHECIDSILTHCFLCESITKEKKGNIHQYIEGENKFIL